MRLAYQIRTKLESFSPAQLAVLSFLLLILSGTGLLLLPSSSSSGVSVIDALFTSTSAVCVTGLAVLDTGTDFTRFGQLSILTLIQLGGLGMMVWSGGVLFMLGGSLGLRERVLLSAQVPRLELSQMKFLIRGTVGFTIVVEITGALLLWMLWTPRLGYFEAAYAAVFHSVSAFCNAGFSLWSDSLSADVEHAGVNLVVAVLIILGGLGYLIVLELSQRKRKRMSLHSRLALSVTGILIVSGAILFYLLEHDNSGTLAALSPAGRVIASVFQSVTTRTAGFNTIDIGSCHPSTQQVLMLFMFVGACPGSTAGGLKVTTVAVLLVATWNYLQGKREMSIWERRLPSERVIQALALLGLMLFFVWLGPVILSCREPFGLGPLLFEAVSAVATVGLSTGITAKLSLFSKLVVCLLMFVGRVGPLTLALALTSGGDRSRIRYVKEDIGLG